MMNRKLGLNWGKGPKLYAEEFDEKGDLVRKYQRNAEIEKWLKSWNYEKYLLKASTDFSFIESHYTKLNQQYLTVHLENPSPNIYPQLKQ